MSDWTHHFRCPDCRSGALLPDLDTEQVACDHCGSIFAIVARRPVLFQHDHSLFAAVDYRGTVDAPRKTSRFRTLLNSLLPSPSVNLSNRRMLGKFIDILDSRGPSNLLVVGGGRQRVWLDPILLGGVAHRICYVDVDVGASVDIFCDAQEIPFADDTFDGVITTAVLEHVMYPERAVSEMARVIVPGGLIYSELPFMQQVHEGAYDFTRYTLSGHRRLLNDFAEIEAGMVAGPATALVWAIENFVLALMPTFLRPISKATVRLTLGWVKYIDWLLKNRPQAMDGASCTYFFGRRREGSDQTADSEIISRYVGGAHLTHK